MCGVGGVTGAEQTVDMGRGHVNDKQRKVLEWLASGATQDPPEPEMKLSAAALRSRGLVRVRRLQGKWTAELTGSGRHYVEHGDYPPEREPTQRPSARSTATATSPNPRAGRAKTRRSARSPVALPIPPALPDDEVGMRITKPHPVVRSLMDRPMAQFREEHDQHFIHQAKAPREDKQAFRRWADDIAVWLNSTDHVSVKYGVEYDGVAIEQLSPGTRGIVLLLLYLAVDQSDDRRLITDQPEENLDPKSIFDELVGRFIDTRHRRQIIIVTHNANLVVNTDADQVIVANAGGHRPGQLPEMSYTSGGLENPTIRQTGLRDPQGGSSCLEPARRLRIKLPT